MINNAIVTEAIEYILLHIWDGVTLEEVAGHCHMSISYFSKIFKEQTGQSVYAFIKKIKMEQSALKIKMEAGRRITDIGEDYGYSASNYSVAFTQYHKISPSAFREDVSIDPQKARQIIDEINLKVRIELKPDRLVMYEHSIGNYQEMKEVWCRFVKRYKADINEKTMFFERTFDDPTITIV